MLLSGRSGRKEHPDYAQSLKGLNPASPSMKSTSPRAIRPTPHSPELAIDPFSWTPESLGERSPRWERHVGRTSCILQGTPHGSLWVTAYQRLIKLTLDVGGNPTSSEYFSPGGNPYGVAIEPGSGRIFYTAINANFIAVLDPTNPAQSAAMITNVCDSGINSPRYMAFGQQGDLFVTCARYEGATADIVAFPGESLVGIQGTWAGAALDPRRVETPELVAAASIVWITTTITVPIDIKPGNDLNVINLGSNGVVQVAIVSDPSVGFDAITVDPTTVTLSGATVKLLGNGTPLTTFKDVNGDGFTDLVVQVNTEAFELSGTATEAILEAETLDGGRIRGVDMVTIVP